jgi:hypothetical protein
MELREAMTKNEKKTKKISLKEFILLQHAAKVYCVLITSKTKINIQWYFNLKGKGCVIFILQ